MGARAGARQAGRPAADDSIDRPPTTPNRPIAHQPPGVVGRVGCGALRGRVGAGDAGARGAQEVAGRQAEG
eukprot:scaffold21691_cov21-Prasinocladus_malaysianus.AAC.2